MLKKLLRLWLIHSCIIAPVAALLYIFDSVAAYSVLLGGLIFLIPNIYLAVCVFYRNVESLNGVVLSNFYKGEVGKFLLSAAGFAVVFAVASPVSAPVLFVTYVGLTLVQSAVVARLGF